MRSLLPAMAVALVSAALVTGGASSDRGAPLVRTDNGWVHGTQAVDHVVHQGIPYAAPPVGDRRWRYRLGDFGFFDHPAW